MRSQVAIKRIALNLILKHALSLTDAECCGLLAGHDGVISSTFPASNALHSATAFEIAPADLFTSLKRMRAVGLDFLGIYHSHPTSENTPSPTDIERAFYPDTAYFIVSPQPNAEKPIRAFRIREGEVTELEIEVIT
jgi:proteasome lid subunit RPN8/RPN11